VENNNGMIANKANNFHRTLLHPGILSKRLPSTGGINAHLDWKSKCGYWQKLFKASCYFFL